MHMMGWGPHGCLCTHLIKATASLRGQIEHSSNLSDLIYPVKPFYCKICCLHIRRGPRPPTCLASLALRFVDTWHVMIWCHVTRITSQHHVMYAGSHHSGLSGLLCHREGRHVHHWLQVPNLTLSYLISRYYWLQKAHQDTRLREERTLQGGLQGKNHITSSRDKCHVMMWCLQGGKVFRVGFGGV